MAVAPQVTLPRAGGLGVTFRLGSRGTHIQPGSVCWGRCVQSFKKLPRKKYSWFYKPTIARDPWSVRHSNVFPSENKKTRLIALCFAYSCLTPQQASKEWFSLIAQRTPTQSSLLQLRTATLIHPLACSGIFSTSGCEDGIACGHNHKACTYTFRLTQPDSSRAIAC